MLSSADHKWVRELLFVVEKSVADTLPEQPHAKLMMTKTDDDQNPRQQEPTIELISNLIIIG